MAKKTISKKIRNKVVNYLKLVEENGVSISSAYIFGSYVKGENNKFSDIDVCIVSDKLSDTITSVNFLNSLTNLNEEFLDIEAHGLRKSEFNNPYLGLSVEVKNHGIKII